MQLARTLAVLLFFLISGPNALALEGLRGVARLGGDFGGDSVIQFKYSDGSTPDFVAGGGLLLSVGAAWEAWEQDGHAIELRGMVGLKYRTIPPATNQTASWLRYPVDLLLMYRSPLRLNLGIGPTFHLGNSLSVSGSVANGGLSFKNSTGFLAQLEYDFGKWALDGRYTSLSYEVASGGSGTLGASSFGFGLSYFF